MKIKFLQIKRALSAALFVLLMVAEITKAKAQDYSMGTLTENGILSTVNDEMVILNVKEIQSYEEKIAVLYGVWADDRFWVNADENDGAFLVGPTEMLNKNGFETALSEAITQSCEVMYYLSKEERAEALENMKQELPNDFLLSVMMDYYDRSMNSGNNLCISAERICFQNGLYTFPAGVNTGSAEVGPDYSCLRTQPNPAWFFVEMQEPGNISVYMYTTPSYDIDFCCWGPFADLNVCPYGLTSNKVVSCSYSASATETCQIPSTAQPGEYYIMVITNYSNRACNINFSKTGGTGNSDCTGSDYYITSNSPVCYGSNLNLYARYAQGASYFWVGPDGWTSTQKDPVRTNMNMNYTGDYYCFITVDNDTISMSCNVECTPAVIADFDYTSVCYGDTTEFVCMATTNPPGYAITSINWNFGDGTTATGYSVKHRYASAGNKSVTMTVQSEEACTGSKTYSVPVYYVPNANAGNDKYVGVGGTVTLAGTGGTGDFSYHWSPEDLVENPNSTSTITLPLYETQDFVLTVTSNVGDCTTSTDTVRVIVDPNAMTGTVFADDTELCHGTSTQLHAVASNGTGSYSYSWTPTIGLSNSNIANPTASPTVTTTYTCHFSDGQTTLDLPVTIDVHPTYYSISTVSVCNEPYTWYGQTYTEPGVYVQHFSSIYGCDSIIGLNLVNAIYETIEVVTCGSYEWNGITYNQSGSYEQTFTSVNNCDSIVTLNLTINNDVLSVDLYETVCDSYYWNGMYLNQSGIYQHVFQSMSGCDSIVNLHLTIYNSENETYEVTTCEPYWWHGIQYSQSGTYYYQTYTSHGCLREETLQLTMIGCNTINATANPSGGGIVYYDKVFDFEQGLDGWTTIDGGTPAGFGWKLASTVIGTGYGHNGSIDCVLSQSYNNNYGVIYPDNYLISPQIALGGSISFYACALDANYSAEHFGVAVSTDGNTNPNDFTTIQEWTMTAKSVGAPTEVTRSGNRAQGNWYQYTVDLSAYSGVGYVAIRHFNCADMFCLDVDDITITQFDTSGGLYCQGQTCFLTAVPNNGFAFTNWTENGEIVSTEPVYSFTVESDRDLVANFAPITKHWTAESYQNSMFMIGVVQIDGIEQTSPALELGAFCNGECRGSEFPVEDGGQWLYFMTIGGNSGDEITFRLYDHVLQQELNLYCFNVIPFEVYGLIGMEDPYEVVFASMLIVSVDVSPENAGTITGTGGYVQGMSATLTATPNEGYAFNSWTLDGEVVSTEPSYTFTVTESVNLTANFDVIHTQQLAEGWNWWSTNLEITLDQLKSALVEALPGTIITIKSRTQNTAYNPSTSRWRGTLVSLDVAQMYMICVSDSCEITLTGIPVNPTEHPITIHNGSNWIAFPFNENMLVNDALTGFPAVSGDIIKSRMNNAIYIRGAWRGAVTTLESGQGYIFISNAQEDRTLIFGTNNSK